MTTRDALRAALAEALDHHWLEVYPQATPPFATCSCGGWRLDVTGPKPEMGEQFRPFTDHCADATLPAVIAALDRSDPAARYGTTTGVVLTLTEDAAVVDPNGKQDAILSGAQVVIYDGDRSDPAVGLREAARFIALHDEDGGAGWPCDGRCATVRDIRAALAATPTASPTDPAELIRCEDCGHVASHHLSEFGCYCRCMALAASPTATGEREP